MPVRGEVSIINDDMNGNRFPGRISRFAEIEEYYERKET